MFAVVEDEQHRAFLKQCADGLLGGAAALRARAEGEGEGEVRGEGRGIGQGAEFDPRHLGPAVFLRQPRRERECQPRLATASRAREREKPCLAHQAVHSQQFPLTANETRERGRK
ncbi:MAG: hypothetical protein ABIZ91_09495 [Gemmatimonadaceae bacterium]